MIEIIQFKSDGKLTFIFHS